MSVFISVLLTALFVVVGGAICMAFAIALDKWLPE